MGAPAYATTGAPHPGAPPSGAPPLAPVDATSNRDPNPSIGDPKPNPSIGLPVPIGPPVMRSSAPARVSRTTSIGLVRFERTTPDGPEAREPSTAGEGASKAGRHMDRTTSWGALAGGTAGSTLGGPAAANVDRHMNRATSWGPLAGGNTYPDPNPSTSSMVVTAGAGAHTDRAGPQDPVPVYSPMASQDLTSTHNPAAANAGIANPNPGGHAGQQTAGVAETCGRRPELRSDSQLPVAVAGRRAPKQAEGSPGGGLAASSGSYFNGGGDSYFASSFADD